MKFSFAFGKRLRATRVAVCTVAVSFIVGCGGGGGAVSTSAGSSYWISENATDAERQKYFSDKANEIFDTYVKDDGPGAGVHLTVAGRLVFQRHRGLGSLTSKNLVNEDTLFELASVSKPLTAVAAVQLVERGQLAYSDSLLRWRPEIPASWVGITCLHLLSNTSGIPDYLTNLTRSDILSLDGIPNQGLFARLEKSEKLDFQPGTSARYSSSNFSYLSEVISRASGMDYPAYMRQSVFFPAGMVRTFVRLAGEVISDENIALNDGVSQTIYGASIDTMGGIRIFSTLRDMDSFIAALLNDALVSRSSLKSMTSDVSKAPVFTTGRYYGLGWRVAQGSVGLDIFDHSGALGGYTSLVWVNHRRKVGVIFLGSALDSANAAQRQLYELATAVFP